jgi:hypothetical protein
MIDAAGRDCGGMNPAAAGEKSEAGEAEEAEEAEEPGEALADKAAAAAAHCGARAGPFQMSGLGSGLSGEADAGGGGGVVADYGGEHWAPRSPQAGGGRLLGRLFGQHSVRIPGARWLRAAGQGSGTKTRRTLILAGVGGGGGGQPGGSPEH